MIPRKLRKGDCIRVIAPSRSMASEWITKEMLEASIKTLEQAGLTITYGEHVRELNEFVSSPPKTRAEDLNNAFADDSVQLVLAVTGGYNSNEILPYLDYALIKDKPKALCGFSDITAIENAVYAKTGLVTYSGPNFTAFGDPEALAYTVPYFQKCLFQAKPFEVKPAEEYSDYSAFKRPDRAFKKNDGLFTLVEGKAEGTIVGGNLVTFHALSGTEYMPGLENTVLFVEEDHEESVYTFNRNLTTLTLRKDFAGVKGIAIGRLQEESNISRKELEAIIKNNERLQHIPIIAGADFGHTTPRATFPIGGKARITAGSMTKIEILTH